MGDPMLDAAEREMDRQDEMATYDWAFRKTADDLPLRGAAFELRYRAQRSFAEMDRRRWYDWDMLEILCGGISRNVAERYGVDPAGHDERALVLQFWLETELQWFAAQWDAEREADWDDEEREDAFEDSFIRSLFERNPR